ncbi:unnamed protein product, partial [Amoebophrya sp. A25]
EVSASRGRGSSTSELAINSSQQQGAVVQQGAEARSGGDGAPEDGASPTLKRGSPGGGDTRTKPTTSSTEQMDNLSTASVHQPSSEADISFLSNASLRGRGGT